MGDGFFDTPTRRDVEQRQHSVCLTLFDLLASMSLTQRKKLSAALMGNTTVMSDTDKSHKFDDAVIPLAELLNSLRGIKHRPAQRNHHYEAQPPTVELHVTREGWLNLDKVLNTWDETEERTGLRLLVEPRFHLDWARSSGGGFYSDGSMSLTFQLFDIREDPADTNGEPAASLEQLAEFTRMFNDAMQICGVLKCIEPEDVAMKYGMFSAHPVFDGLYGSTDEVEWRGISELHTDCGPADGSCGSILGLMVCEGLLEIRTDNNDFAEYRRAEGAPPAWNERDEG